MASIIPTLPAASSSNTGNKPNDLKDLDVNHFLKLMITELTNQDPLNPMDNTQLVQQIGEIRQISSTTQLSDTLLSVATGQSLSNASSLIGKTVTALDDKNQQVTGKVDHVSVQIDPKNDAKRTFQIHVGDSIINLNNVRQVQP